MKILLAALMCLVLCTSECFALKGGPPIPAGQVVTTGNYAGLFMPTTTDENSLGIFSVLIPTNGLGRGMVGFFRNGIFYPGTIQGIADPDSAILTAVLTSSFNITFTSETTGDPPTTRNIVITFNANGSIDGHIRPNPNTLSSATARITGSASVTYSTVGSAPGFDDAGANSNGPVPYEVNGFKQSEATQ